MIHMLEPLLGAALLHVGRQENKLLQGGERTSSPLKRRESIIDPIRKYSTGGFGTNRKFILVGENPS